MDNVVNFSGAEKFGEENATQQQIAPWTVVCVTTRTAEQRNAVQEEVNWLWRCGAIPAKHVLVIEDAYPDLGSGGSTLNALLVVSRECDLNRCGSMFMYMGEDFVTPQRCRLPKSLFMMNLSQITELSARFASSGVWICGSDAYWQVDADDFFENVSDNVSSDHSLSVFTFRADAKLARTHGVYRLNAQVSFKLLKISHCYGTSSSVRT
ncbi:unnamed protein product [Anisakis simplex]|uniref:Glyco_trans_2-like domain-containing protein n=1 Tax=Anisakis simplex TaxID=6269 RepID=A0A0M3K6G2_ANISI|nr:unnamed protein product [Anisakis simplex]